MAPITAEIVTLTWPRVISPTNLPPLPDDHWHGDAEQTRPQLRARWWVVGPWRGNHRRHRTIPLDYEDRECPPTEAQVEAARLDHRGIPYWPYPEGWRLVWARWDSEAGRVYASVKPIKHRI